MIDQDLFLAFGAIYKKYNKKEIIFQEGEMPKFFFYIVKGTVAVFNINESGKEFTQGVFYDNQTFGEPPIFVNKPYPASAEAIKDTLILKIDKLDFLELLKTNNKLKDEILLIFSNRIYNKSVTTRSIVNNNPTGLILSFLNDQKQKLTSSNEKIKIPYTRQEIANFIGLRVETVIRTLKKMNDKKDVEIINRKIFF